jgi:16S rRNA (cytosine1402-N4)-methyltransferase
MQYSHIPVMLEEAIKHLKLKKDGNYIDCTLGGAGYTQAIAKQIGAGKVVSIDLDELAINNAREILIKTKINNVILVNDNFKNLTKIIKENLGATAIGRISGIVLDLGLSSAQLQDRSRGFSFQVDTSLDMGFGQQHVSGLTTNEIVNHWSEEELNRIIRDYGEERYARNIAKKIVLARSSGEIITTGQLVKIIKSALPAYYLRKKGIHFATLTFQALRIATNDELNSLTEVLRQSIEVMAPGGRLVVISYHSLEDRIVKHYFRELNKDCICPPRQPICTCEHRAKIKIVTNKAILPTETEVAVNARARSAKLRTAEKI